MEPELFVDDLAERWSLDASNWELLANKSGSTRLGFAALLKFFEAENRFPRSREELPPAAIRFLADQVRVPAEAWEEYRWTGRTIEYHRAQIRAALGFREGGVEDMDALRGWLLEHLLSHERNAERLKDAVAARCRDLRIEPFAPDRIERLIRSAIAAFEEDFCGRLTDAVPLATQQALDGLLLTDSPESGRVPLHPLRADPGSASIETLEEELGSFRGCELSLCRRTCSTGLRQRSFMAIVAGRPSKRSTSCDAILRRCVSLCWLHSAICGWVS